MTLRIPAYPPGHQQEQGSLPQESKPVGDAVVKLLIAWGQRLPLPLTSWATLSEVISFSVPHCPRLKNGVLF